MGYNCNDKLQLLVDNLKLDLDSNVDSLSIYTIWSIFDVYFFNSFLTGWSSLSFSTSSTIWKIE